jgi:hypothetical protein
MIFGLGVMALAMFAESILNIAQELRALMLVGIGIGLAWAVDFNLWSLWHFQARTGWLEVTLTGVFLGGAAYFWSVILGLFSGLLRKFHDEAATLEKTQQVQGIATERVAALPYRRARPKAG